MNTIMMSALTVLGMTGFFGSPATAQSEVKKATDDCLTWTSVYDGKRTYKKYHCVEEEKPRMPDTVRVEVKFEDRQPSDDWGLRIVGKRTDRVYYREVPRASQTSANADCEHTKSKDDCNASYFTVGKRSERRAFCDRNDHRVMCGDKENECKVCQKGM